MSQPPNIYIATPDRDRGSAIAERLSHSHPKTTCYTSFDEVIAACEASAPEVIIIDFSNDPNAFSLCDTIREHTTLKATPVLAITDVEDLQIMQDIYQSGANDLILEPYAQCELQARLSRLVETSKTTASVQDPITQKIIQKIEGQLDNFDLITKIDQIKKELHSNADEMIETHEQLRAALDQAAEAIAKSEYSLQFTDRVAQQVNEIGKLIYGVHISLKREQRPYSDKESRHLEKSSSKSVLEEVDKEKVDDLLNSLNL